MIDITLPEDLQSVIGNEKIAFAVQSKRNHTQGKIWGSFLFGTLLIALAAFLVFIFFAPLFEGKEVHFKMNGVQTTASWQNFKPLLAPAIVLGLFLLIGIGFLIASVYMLYQKGGIFVITDSRIIKYFKGNIKSHVWEQFSGNIVINSRKGNIMLELKTGRMVNRRRTPDRFIPDTVYISGVEDVLAIEKFCSSKILV
jgi:hypothetical protein